MKKQCKIENVKENNVEQVQVDEINKYTYGFQNIIEKQSKE